jgi:decaprenyl-phosphate phosphoribosyltransferase
MKRQVTIARKLPPLQHASGLQEPTLTRSRGRSSWGLTAPYVQIARVDHWFKNVFMLFGILLAYFIQPAFDAESIGWHLLVGFFTACLIASSNYVINEILDARTDLYHPEKQQRPVASGRARKSIAYLEWLLLGAIGLWCAAKIGYSFALAGLGLWVMGLVYNVPPLRTKELPYLDVLTESVNNPIRLLLGWFLLIPDKLPPVSLCIAYWMFGAMFMALKRFAEYRRIADRDRAARYRKSFAYCDDERLLVSSIFYLVIGSLFSGVFVVRYHIELILVTPLAAFLLAYYMRIALQNNSPVQTPERLFTERVFTLFAGLFVLSFVALMYLSFPGLYELFGVSDSNSVEPLWSIGK